MSLRHLDVGEEGDVVAGLHAREMGPEHPGQRATARGQPGRVGRAGEDLQPVRLEDRRLGGEAAGPLVLRRELARGDLARFHVRLIEGVDPQD